MKQIPEYTDLELAKALSEETNSFSIAQQKIQMHANNINLLQEEINKRSQPKPKAKDKK